MQDDARRVIDNTIMLSYLMNGGATYSEIMQMTPGERDRVSSFVEKRLEQEQKAVNVAKRR